MKIAYVCADRGIPFLGFKGASVHMRELATALGSIGHEVFVFCDKLGSGNRTPALASLESLPRDTSEQETVLRDAFERLGINAVLERYSLESGAARAASAKAGIPFVLEVNAPLVLEAQRYRNYQDVEAGLEREQALFQRSDAIVVVSRWLRDYVLQKAPGSVAKVVRNGVDRARFDGARPLDLGLPSGSVAIGFVGSMKPWHGVLDLIDAFSELCKHDQAAHLVLAGEGPQDDLVRDRATQDGLRARVSVLGALPHDRIPSLLAALDIAVAPYRPTDFFYFSPIKIVEYLAAGLPTVFPALDELTDIVAGAAASYPAGNTHALKDSLAKLIADPARRDDLRSKARARSAQFAWTESAKQIEPLLRIQATGAAK